MSPILLCVTIFSLLLAHTPTTTPAVGTSLLACDPYDCNYEDVCSIKDHNLSCDCVGKFFEGETCSQPVDHCASNPCRNGGTCRSYLGHHNCECAAGFSGQTCTSQGNAFKGLHLHYNHIAPLGIKQTFLLTLQSLGDVHILMDFYTPDYIIDGIAFTASSGHFKQSKDLKALAIVNGIRHSDTLPYKSGFYRVLRPVFWKPGVHFMSLDLNDFDSGAKQFFSGHFDILVYEPPGTCFPVIHLPNCENPRKALHMDIGTFNFVEPIVDSRCEEHSHFKVKWSVRNYINTVVLHEFPKLYSPVLTIPPYTMWFNFRDDYVQSYLIQGAVTELDTYGADVSSTVIRCYVFVDSKHITAHILGGEYREVNVNNEFVLDGSRSRDDAMRPGHPQGLKYSWSCESEDSQNKYCTKYIGSAALVHVPARVLSLNFTYKYSLRIRSSINTYSSDKATQVVKPISQAPLLLDFHCLRNCAHDKFAAEKVIHLKVVCLNCPRGDVAYIVTDENGSEVSTTHRVVLTESSKKEVSLRADATVRSRKGTATIKLTLNSPPSKGSCKISPTSGVEYLTVFTISCSGYEDEDIPIDYSYKAGDTVLDHSGNDTLSTRLFPTSGQSCAIKISVCDDIGACAEVRLQVSLTPLSPGEGGSWAKFLSMNGTNLKELIENGDRSAANALIRAVIPHISGTESFAVAAKMVKALKNLRLDRLLAVEQVLTAASRLLDAIQVTNTSVLLVSELFYKVTDGLRHSIRNKEVKELPVETHAQMLGELSAAMARASTKVEAFPMVQDTDLIYPHEGHFDPYPDYDEMNATSIQSLYNWVDAFTQMYDCLKVMGVVSAFIQLPDEAAVMIQKNGVTSKTLVVDTSERVSLSWNEPNTFVSLPSSFLQSGLRQELAIQVTIFEANPLWWHPNKYMLNTEVLSVGVYSRELESDVGSFFDEAAFTYVMAINETAMTEDDRLINGSLKNSLQMQVYEKRMPPNGVLVVTFQPLDNDLNVVLKFGRKPRSYMFDDARITHRAKASQEATVFVLVNPMSAQSTAYLAIRSESPANFSFSMMSRVCLSWDPKSYEWTSAYCSVGDKTNATHIQCSCWHLSVFGAKVHRTFVDPPKTNDLVYGLSINWNVLVLCMFATLLLLCALYSSWRRERSAIAGRIVLASKPRGENSERYVVTIYTSGQPNAETTSNITIQLHGMRSQTPEYTLYSSRNHALFKRNLQASFVIYLSSSLGDLRTVSLKHDNFGRYPSWNVHAVKVRDETNKNIYIFLVNQWLSDFEGTSCTASVSLPKAKQLQSGSQILRACLTDAFTNWYPQHVWGSAMLFETLTPVEKATIFVVRVCIALTGVFLSLGPTTIYTYEEERETSRSMLQNFGELMVVAFFCHLVGVLIAVGLHYLFSMFRWEKDDAEYTVVSAV